MAIFQKNDRPVKVTVPTNDARGLSSKVGLIAAVGFALGVAWPRLLGLEVGPDVPGGKKARAAAAAAASPSTSAVASAAPPDEDGDAEAADAPDGPSNKQLAVVGTGVIRNCRNKKGDKQDSCGKLNLDKLVSGRLASLAGCPSAIGLEGKLWIGLAVNFDKSELLVIEDEKSALPGNTVKGVLRCAAEELKDIELDKITHHEPRVTVAFPINFYPPGRGPEPDAPPETAAAEGDKTERATISWEKALLRETPKDGKVVARVPQGTRVVVLESRDDWHLIEAGKVKGWVYRQAIGK